MDKILFKCTSVYNIKANTIKSTQINLAKVCNHIRYFPGFCQVQPSHGILARDMEDITTGLLT
jgi:hypothetical protein